MTGMKILIAPSFDRSLKKLHARDKETVDRAIREIASSPLIGQEKKGDLAGVFVHKFKVNKQEVLLAYRLHPGKNNPQELVLLSLGSHENFYTALKR
ncbi:MAG: type II toxin-antitoxin system RelE/ParE family toxin [Burkholderiaceae bacterium]|jgi:mRNA-degrading endonuclease RelE of RelBE toxin-antitoxin system|nr:type II toxin-antitoxin system RelE/ParE family toxin [Burkholderiaceae bacterium]